MHNAQAARVSMHSRAIPQTTHMFITSTRASDRLRPTCYNRLRGSRLYSQALITTST